MHALVEAVGLPDKLKNVSHVRESVEQCSGHFLVPKNGRPVSKAQIGCDNHRDPLVTVIISVLSYRVQGHSLLER